MSAKEESNLEDTGTFNYEDTTTKETSESPQTSPDESETARCENDEWDETPLSERLRCLGKEKPPQNDEVYVNSEDQSKKDDGGHDDAEIEASDSGRQTQSKRPNIWKELERMQQCSARGGHRDNVGPRFQKASDKTEHDWRDFGSSRGGYRFPKAGGHDNSSRPWNRRNWDGGSFGSGSERRRFQDDDLRDSFAMTKEFKRYSMDAGNSSDAGSFRSSRGSARGRGSFFSRATGIARPRNSGGRSAGSAFLDRQIDDEENESDVGFDRTRATGFGSSLRRSSDREEYSQSDANPDLKFGKGNSRWLEDDRDVVATRGGNRAQLGSWASDDSVFEPLKKALDQLDHSSQSSRAAMGILCRLADEYCDNDSDRWLELIDEYVMAFALAEGDVHSELVTTLFVRWIDRPLFQKTAYISLMRCITDLMAPHEWTEERHRETRNMCDLFGRVLVAQWPPGWDSSAKECNSIVYAIMNALHTWLQALDKSTSSGSAVREGVVEASAIALCHLTAATGRKLWLKWPDVVDQMYGILRSVIVSACCGLTEGTKLQLLDLYVKLLEWPKPTSRQATKRDSGVQTDWHDADSAQTEVGWTSRPSAFQAVTSLGRYSHDDRRIPPSQQPPGGQNARQHFQQGQSGMRGMQPTSNCRFSYIGPLRKQ